MTLGAGKEQVDVSVYGPDSVTAHSSLIAEDLGQILADHGLKGRSVQVQKHTRPLTLTEVFPGLFEGSAVSMSKSKQGGSGRAVALQYGPGSGAPVIVASGMGTWPSGL